MTTVHRALAWTTLVAACLLLAEPLLAQDAPDSGEPLVVHPEAVKAIGGIKSPYCPGMMLENCPSPGAAAIRDSIQHMAEAGLRADSIIELVLGEYGEQWRAEPRASGTGLWAWLLPPAGLLVGLAAVGVALSRRRGVAGREATAAAPLDPEDEVRIREAIQALEEAEEPAL